MQKWHFFVGAALLLAVGCQQDTTRAPAGATVSTPDFVRKPEFENIPGQIGQAYELQRDRMINGINVSKGRIVFGLIDKNANNTIFQETKFVMEREYASILSDDRFIFAQRYGDAYVTRYDVVGGRPVNPQPTEYNWVYRRQVRNTGPLEWIGVVAKSNVATVMNRAAQPVQRIHLTDYFSYSSRCEALASKNTFVVHGEDGDHIADETGIPMSPTLPRLWSTKINREKWAGEEWVYDDKRFAVVIDDQKKRYWPVLDDGKIFPKPDDCLGIQPAIGEYLGRERWAGWLVWWKTDRGERCVLVDVDVPYKDNAALIASREKATWSEIVVFYNGVHRHFDLVRRAEPNGPYQAGDAWGEMMDSSLPSIEAAQKFLEKAYEQHQIAVDRREAAAKAAREDLANFNLRQQQEQKQADEARSKAFAEKLGQDFDAAMASGDKNLSRTCVLKLFRDPARWTRYVKKWGLDPDDNSSLAVGYSRASLGGTDSAVLEEAMKRLNPFPVTNAGPQSDWDYFWNGPRDGSYSGPKSNYQVDPRLTPDGAMKAQHDREIENAKAWLRGAQNWGALKN